MPGVMSSLRRWLRGSRRCGFLSGLGWTGNFLDEYPGSEEEPTETVFSPPETSVFDASNVDTFRRLSLRWLGKVS